jgi:hypothetical protein
VVEPAFCNSRNGLWERLGSWFELELLLPNGIVRRKMADEDLEVAAQI